MSDLKNADPSRACCFRFLVGDWLNCCFILSDQLPSSRHVSRAEDSIVPAAATEVGEISSESGLQLTAAAIVDEPIDY